MSVNNFNAIDYEEFLKYFEKVARLKYKKDKKRSTALGERESEYICGRLHDVFYELARVALENQDKVFEERLDCVIMCLNQNLKNNKDVKDLCLLNNPKQLKVTSFDGLYLDADIQNNGQIILKDFIARYKTVRKEFSHGSFSLSSVNNYLDAYLSVTKFIFNMNILSQDELRTHNIIEDILNFESKKSNDENDDMEFSLLSPFSLNALLRSILAITKMPECEPKIKNDLQQELHAKIAATYAVRSFRRYLILNEETYLASPSRRHNCVLSKRTANSSSLENTKPIRLLEKIIDQIFCLYRDSNEEILKFSVVVFGYLNLKSKEDSKSQKVPEELIDLINEIFSFYDDFLNDPDDKKSVQKKLELSINYYLTISEDEFKKKTKSKTVHKGFKGITNVDASLVYRGIDKDKEIGDCHIKIEWITSQMIGQKSLVECMEAYDLLFFLDAPWLTVEEYERADEGYMDTFCQKLSNSNYRKSLEIDLHNDSLLTNRNHLFSDIQNQLNRVATNYFTKYGTIIRLPKDYLLNWIQNYLHQLQIQQQQQQAGNRKKTVYLYLSSTKGLSFSSFTEYPITRVEKYNNKEIHIMRFSTEIPQIMRFSTEIPQNITDSRKIVIEISLWALIKYIDISLIYTVFKERLCQVFYQMIDLENDIPQYTEISSNYDKVKLKKAVFIRDFISITRSIKFQICPDISNEKVEIGLGLCSLVKQRYNANHINDMDEKIKELTDFFKFVIKEIVFNNQSYKHETFNNDCVRDAFAQCIYNESKSINGLFFHYWYLNKRDRRELNHIKIEFKKSFDFLESKLSIDLISPNRFETFADKYIYSNLLNSLSYPEPQFRRINRLLLRADMNFSDGHARLVLDNLRTVCEANGFEETDLYINILNKIKEV